MAQTPQRTRRTVLKLAGAGLATAAVGAGTATAGNLRSGGDKGFGRVYANGQLWRTLVVKLLEERAANEDLIYFLHDGSKPIIANGMADSSQASPFVSETVPGDADYNGGKWTHMSAEVTDIQAFNDDAPLTSESDVVGAEYIDVTLGRPGFGPPNYFICPLNGPV